MTEQVWVVVVHVVAFVIIWSGMFTMLLVFTCRYLCGMPYSYEYVRTYMYVRLLLTFRYTVMQGCWAREPQMRPGFFAIREQLESLLFALDDDNTSQNVRVEDMRYDVPDVVSQPPGEKC